MSMIEKIYEGLHMDERLREGNCPRMDELLQHFRKTLPESEFLLLDELMSRQSILSAQLFSEYFTYGVRTGFQLSKELSEEIDDIEAL